MASDRLRQDLRAAAEGFLLVAGFFVTRAQHKPHEPPKS